MRIFQPLIALLGLLAGLQASPALSQVQPFSSGSDGSYGPINITANSSLQVPESGVFNATTIDIAASRTLTFIPNSRNTPVQLLATGAVNISGNINIRGENGNPERGGLGGPGGFAGGNPGGAAGPASAGLGPGGGLPGTNSSGANAGSAGGGNHAEFVGTFTANDGQPYGSPLLIPLIGGSGGGGTNNDDGGGGGGGAILIASDVSITGFSGANIDARGGNGSTPNNGSGGGIRLVAPVVNGVMTLNVGGTGFGPENVSGHGFVRIDTLDFSDVDGIGHSPNVPAAFSIGSFMLVEPSPLPRLDVIAAAGTVIPEGSGPAVINLPNGSPSTQTVTVQGRDFTGIVPIEVVVTPQNGDPTTVLGQIDMGTGNPATVDVQVEIPTNTTAVINAWRR